VGLDPTPAPLGDASIGAAIEAFTGKKFGESGTMTCDDSTEHALHDSFIEASGRCLLSDTIDIGSNRAD
jgi:hypothetical protein